MSENDRMIDYKMYSIRPYFGSTDCEKVEERKFRSFRYILAVPAPLSKEQEETILRMISLFATKRVYPYDGDVKVIAPDMEWR